MRILRISLIVLAITSSGCASGIKHKDLQASIPTLTSDQGRIYFLRSASMVGAAIQPAIRLDGEEVGQSKPGGFFFIDRKSGAHEVVCSTEVDKKLSFKLETGEVKYVQTSLSFGILAGRVTPELISQEEAQKLLPELSYTGNLAISK